VNHNNNFLFIKIATFNWHIPYKKTILQPTHIKKSFSIHKNKSSVFTIEFNKNKWENEKTNGWNE
jgi:hypothetical protein